MPQDLPTKYLGIHYQNAESLSPEEIGSKDHNGDFKYGDKHMVSWSIRYRPSVREGESIGFVRTSDHWYGDWYIAGVRCVQMLMINNPPGYPNAWWKYTISFWGTDDCTMQKRFPDESAMRHFLKRLRVNLPVTKKWLEAEGFTY